ncbi:MAG: arginine--tRNA ligase [Candidatus Altiarchaeota archaeon]|nr:arginine--tRNA ligase [Candidatus Altiarchaeota archaeon]
MFPSIKEEVRNLLEKAAKEPVSIDDVAGSPVADICSPISFRIAKKKGKDPVLIAEEIAKRIKPTGIIKEVKAEKGYINFFLDYGKLLTPLTEVVSRGADYGRLKRRDEKIVLEHTSINPSGPVHIGRLRNSLIGDSLARILRFNGYEVETHYYVNDVGKQIAIIAQGFKEGIKPDESVVKEYKEYKDKPDFQVFFEYVASNKLFESDPGFAERVQKNIWLAENGDREALKEITDVAKKCLKGQKEIFDKLDIGFDFFDFESEYIRNNEVKSVLDFLKKSEYVRKTENGLGLDLSCFGLERRGGLSMLARSDGTSVYLTRDIAYHLRKIELGDRLINVLGEDHKFEFRELKTILAEVYGIKKPLGVVHYSFVSFEGLELSTRKGQTAPIDKLIDEAVEKAENEITKRDIASKNVAPVIGIGAIKYHILKTSPLKQILFDWDEALSFEGEASPYVQYAHARCCSILRKSKTAPDQINLSDDSLTKDEEQLILKIAKFPEIVESAGRELKPNIIATYLFELASLFSRFYKECPVLSEMEKIRDRRLLLVDSTRQTLKNGLYLLGIDAPDRM